MTTARSKSGPTAQVVLNRYGKLDYLQDDISAGRLTFGNPAAWSDRTDTTLVSEFMKKNSCADVKAICFSTQRETIHSWGGFHAATKEQACLELSLAELESLRGDLQNHLNDSSVENAKDITWVWGFVQYIFMEDGSLYSYGFTQPQSDGVQKVGHRNNMQKVDKISHSHLKNSFIFPADENLVDPHLLFLKRKPFFIEAEFRVCAFLHATSAGRAATWKPCLNINDLPLSTVKLTLMEGASAIEERRIEASLRQKNPIIGNKLTVNTSTLNFSQRFMDLVISIQ